MEFGKPDEAGIGAIHAFAVSVEQGIDRIDLGRKHRTHDNRATSDPLEQSTAGGVDSAQLEAGLGDDGLARQHRGVQVG